MVGLISDATGNIRYAFFFLAGMMYVALPLLRCVDVERGQEDARRYVAEREDGERARGGYVAVPRGDVEDPS
jgi:UMF1 family MFS transporter